MPHLHKKSYDKNKYFSLCVTTKASRKIIVYSLENKCNQYISFSNCSILIYIAAALRNYQWNCNLKIIMLKNICFVKGNTKELLH